MTVVETVGQVVVIVACLGVTLLVLWLGATR
jgi:hypothetical protein